MGEGTEHLRLAGKVSCKSFLSVGALDYLFWKVKALFRKVPGKNVFNFISLFLPGVVAHTINPSRILQGDLSTFLQGQPWATE